MDHCKSTLSAPRRNLLETIQQTYFGTIGSLPIENGEPMCALATIRQEIKLGLERTPRNKPWPADFELRAQVLDLFEHFDRLRNALVTIEIRHGLPHRLTVIGPTL